MKRRNPKLSVSAADAASKGDPESKAEQPAGAPTAATCPKQASPPLPSSLKPQPSPTFPIVGIGASAGGLEAFTELLQNLATDTGMAFVLVHHLDPAHTSALTQLL